MWNVFSPYIYIYIYMPRRCSSHVTPLMSRPVTGQGTLLSQRWKFSNYPRHWLFVVHDLRLWRFVVNFLTFVLKIVWFFKSICQASAAAVKWKKKYCGCECESHLRMCPLTRLRSLAGRGRCCATKVPGVSRACVASCSRSCYAKKTAGKKNKNKRTRGITCMRCARLKKLPGATCEKREGEREWETERGKEEDPIARSAKIIYWFSVQ